MPRNLRPIDYDEDMGAGDSNQTEPAMNLRSTVVSGGTNRAGSHGETQISPYDYVQVGLPKTHTTKLNYYALTNTTISTGTSSSAVASFSWRLNSIYDCANNVTFTAIDGAAPTADVADGSVNTPKWRTYFSNIYNYWTVLGCQYNIRVRCTSQRTNNGVFAVFLYKHGAQAPPTLNTTGGLVVPFDYKKLHPDVEYKLGTSQHVERTRDDEVTSNNSSLYVAGSEKLEPTWIEFSGTIKPGDVHHEVQEDELHQTWHRNTEVPPIREMATIHIMRHPSSADVELAFQIEVDLMYLTQWKDIKASLQYITATSQVLGAETGAVAQVL